jgi:hypothetical protein
VLGVCLRSLSWNNLGDSFVGSFLRRFPREYIKNVVKIIAGLIQETEVPRGTDKRLENRSPI